MDYRVLGPLETRHRGQPIDVGARQQRALLALLLINANRVVSTERILEGLWADDPTGKERTLWVYISRLRGALEPDRPANAKSTVLVTRDHGYSLVIDPDELDANQFEATVTEARQIVRDQPDKAAAMLAEALSLWHGTAYEDFQYEDFARMEVGRLEELRLEAIENRIDADLRLGRHREVIGDLDQLMQGHPLRERPVGLAMVALYRSGRQADALRVFQIYRRRIADELGLEPSPELARIEEQVLLHDVRLRPARTGDTSEAGTSADNPFKGLQAFTEDDAARFFGRDGLISDLVRRLKEGSRLVALVGASGSGKSSVLQAGFIPAVRKGAVDDREWLVARMVPGAKPFAELEAGLLRATLDTPDSLSELFEDPDDGILRACLRVLPDVSSRLLLVVDQFEELFTLVESEKERRRFIRNLEVVLDDPHGRVAVVLALRADFYARPLEHPQLAHHLADGIVHALPLRPDELEVAAEQPAAHAGVTLEPTLLVSLLSDVAGQPGGLPLFQYALTELFDRRDGVTLTAEAYADMGGVKGALARRAEDLFLDFEASERDVAKQLFLRLVTIVDEGAWTRRRVTGSEIVTLGVDVVALQRVLDRLGAHRLVTFDRDRSSGSPTVEVAHEALLQEWPRLRTWIEEGRNDVRQYRRFALALAEWKASGAKTDYLLSGERLADYEEWAGTSTLRLTEEDSRFLDDSTAHRDAARRAEDERSARETLLDRKARRRLRELAIVGGILGILIVGSIVVAWAGRQPTIAVLQGVTGDLGMNDLILAGADDAELEFGLDIERVTTLVDKEEDLRRLAESGADLIVVSRDFDLTVERVAPHFRDVHFVALDPVALHIEAPNITEIHFAVEDSAFLAGAAAAMTTETGKVGFLGGYMTFPAEGSRSGFEQGVSFQDPDMVVDARYLGPIPNPAVSATSSPDLAYELALEMYGDGVDVIFHDAGESGLGVLRAARELSDDARHLWVIGSDADLHQITPSVIDRGHVLSSSVKRFDAATLFAVEAFLEGTLTPGETTVGLGDDALKLSLEGDYLQGHTGQLENLRGEIAFNHLRVHGHSVTSPGWQFEPDVTVGLELAGTSCTVTSVDGAELDGDRIRIPRGAVVEFDFFNHTDAVAGISLRTVQSTVTLEGLAEEARSGIPRSFQDTLGITLLEPQTRTSVAAAMTASTIVPNCIRYEPTSGPADISAVLVSPAA